MKSIRDLDLNNKTVFLRVDFNVPIDQQTGVIVDDTRIQAALPTIQHILKSNARLIIASHLGRPDGHVCPEMSLQPVAERLGQLLNQSIHFAPDCIGAQVVKLKAALQPGQILLLENVRFHAEEEANDMAFAQELAHGIDVYIDDAFGAIHRKHATIYAVPSLIAERGAGLLIEREINALNQLTTNPQRPVVTVMGGVKISDKVDVIQHIAPLSDVLLVGGALANTFFKGLGTPVGASITDDASFNTLAAQIWQRYEGYTVSQFAGVSDKLHRVQLPLDMVAAPSPTQTDQARVIEIGVDTIPDEWMFLDIGPKTAALYAQIIAHAATVFWNGPLGMTEVPACAKGSETIAQAIADCSGYSVIGGGDTEELVNQFQLQGRFSHVSTGGGASLMYIGGQPLPGLEILE